MRTRVLKVTEGTKSPTTLGFIHFLSKPLASEAKKSEAIKSDKATRDFMVMRMLNFVGHESLDPDGDVRRFLQRVNPYE